MKRLVCEDCGRERSRQDVQWWLDPKTGKSQCWVCHRLEEATKEAMARYDFTCSTYSAEGI